MTDETQEPQPEPVPSKWGKCKTDPATWWEKGGPSPNPKGRPKGAKNLKTIYVEAFEKKKFEVMVDGKKEIMSPKELGYHQVAKKSAAGDLKAFQIQKELDEKFEPPISEPPTPEESATDFQTLEAWIELREKFQVFAKPADEAEQSKKGNTDNG